VPEGRVRGHATGEGARLSVDHRQGATEGKIRAMTRVQAIEEQIKSLSPGEVAELRDWLLEHDDAEWDRQIERDAAEGKLEKLFSKARADHAAGKSIKL